MTTVIRFYEPDGPYGVLSNHSAHPLVFEGKTWPTVEHRFQAAKFAGTIHEEYIRLADTSSRAADMGRERHRPLRTDWDSVKDDLMREAVLAKFTQHPELRAVLLDTGEADLVEHTANDRYWGDGGDGTGHNMLGKILMETRAKLQGR